jgi:kumamolisin
VSAFAEHVRLKQSGMGTRPDGGLAGDVPPDEKIDVTVLMRAGSEHDQEAVDSLMGGSAPADRDHLDLGTLESRQGTTRNDLAKVEAFAEHYGLTVSDRHPERRTLTLSGTADQMRAAFRVAIQRYTIGDTTYRVRTGPVHVPKELAHIVQGVVGFDTRPQVLPHIRSTATGMVAPRGTALRTFTPIEIADLYSFPSGTDGAGETVAILEFGGGFDQNDLNTYFSSMGIANPPSVIGIAVDGAGTDAGRDTGADGEVQLDIDVVGAVAPRSTIVVYCAPNSARGFVDALKTAVHNHDHRPCAISISWGMAEENWSDQTRTQMDQAFRDAGMLGITICAASGDDGSTDNQPQGAPHVDYPAASPWVLGCGGTMLEAEGGSISSETVWNDLAAGGGASGGGISTIYDRPAWQAANTVTRARDGGRTGRGVPDVSGDACPSTGYRVRVDGQDNVVGGTSAVAPLWAALIARMTQSLGTSIGYMQPLIYDPSRTGSMKDVTSGNNGDYDAANGWDPCTGLGSPDGRSLLGSMSATTATSRTARRR